MSTQTQTISQAIKGGMFVRNVGRQRGKVALWDAINHFGLTPGQIGQIFPPLESKFGHVSITAFENDQHTEQHHVVQVLELAGL